MTAHNYAAKALRSLKQSYQSDIPHHLNDEELSFLQGMIAYIEKAVHFSLPDDGRILNDGLIGLRGDPLHLPFPVITIEFNSKAFQNPNHVDVPILLVCIASSEVREVKEPDDDFVINIGVFQHPNSDKWLPFAVGMKVPAHWDANVTENGVFNGESFHIFRKVTNIYSISESTDVEKVSEMVKESFAYVTSAMLELCEALSCSNVEVGTLQEASPKNTKRIKQGKLPILETKTLVINTHRQPGTGKSYQLDGGKRSPRQHLRRGHIRFLQADRFKNKQGQKIWVNSTVVGGEGKIEKTYEVR